MEENITREKIIQEYERFIVVEIICKNGSKYRGTRENPKYIEKIKNINMAYNNKKQEEAKRVGRKYFKNQGYHKRGNEIHRR